MEKRVIFQEDMDAAPGDFNDLQSYAQGGIDHIVADAITGDRRYAGFDAAATGVTTLTVQPGRLYSAGVVYAADQVYIRDFTTSLPVATRKIVSLAVFGDEVDTDQTTREFLLNEETGASEPRQVAMTRARVANVNTVVGQESADPIAPIVPTGALVVATILLTPAGIASVDMVAATALDSIEGVANRVATVEDFRDKALPQIASLGSDIAALTAGQSRLVSKENYGRSLGRLAVLEAKQGIPAAAVDSTADFFLDARGSDLVYPGSNVSVAEGIRFAPEAVGIAPLGIFNPLNPAAKIAGGMLFPAYTRKLRQSVGPSTGEVQASQFTYGVQQVVQRTISRVSITYGRSATVCTNSAWWQSGAYDPLSGIFRVAGETWTVDPSDRDKALGHYMIRTQQFWEDTYEEPYWDVVTVNSQVNGTQIAETFLQANDMWLDAVGLTFTRLAADGQVTLAICETDRGLPLLDKVLSKTTVERQTLGIGKNVIPLQPVFLTGGKRYAIVVITAADHWVGTVPGTAFPSGTFFYVLDGAYQQGDATRDLAFDLYAAEFATARAVIDLNPLTLNGGISTINIIAPAIIPGSTQLTFEIQVAGIWYPLAKTEDLVLGAGGVIPPLLPFRAVFTGSPDMMPGIMLTGSQVTVSRSRTALAWFSTPRILPGAGSASIRVIARLEDFETAHHTAAITLLTGVAYATETAASSIVDAVGEDGVIERTWIFNLGAAVTQYRMKATATTDSALDVFHFAWRKDYAL
ncbi:hypothetical protein [Sphingomonas oligophenolica]|uniref:Uncharacterized protein n=1 Tax=Sphingomonas oligophenolica TaxID=301154 RepID=A0A502CNY6_9SPHN|nr:hypothetical protein [Sphingomonas oligophenolica]TPG14364.1 hypothetical protein EAH84_03385 [Sphingomonas oligophenolica]